MRDVQDPTSAQVKPQSEKSKRSLSGLDSVLLRPTDRPAEPITQGMPFGEGKNFLRMPEESSRQFVKRVATDLANSPTTGSRSKAFLARVMRGE